MSIVLHTLQNISEKCSGICRLLPRGEWPYFIILIYIYQVDFCQSGAHKHHLVPVHINTLHDAKNMHLLVSTLDITSWSSTLIAKFPVWVINLPATLWPSQQISIMYWLKWWFFKFQSSVSLTYVDLYDNSSNSSHMLSRYSLTYMAILRIPVICFPGIRWLIWQFFEF